jgi:serine phosphatase RsbU (regulator of sigma subunit)
VEEADRRVGGSAWLLQNIGSVFEINGEIDSAFSYYFKSLEMRESIDHHLGQYFVLRAIGELYNQTGNPSKALEFYNRSIKIGRKHNFKYGLDGSYYQRSLIWKQTGNFENAYEDLNTYLILSDSLQNEESSKLIMKQTMKYEYDKKEALAKAEQEKKDAIDAKEKQLQKYYLFSVIGGLIILIVFMIGLYNRFTTIRKHNKIVDFQKRQLEEKQQKILDSIDYAKKIQTAVLPPKKLIKEYFNNSFVYYRPKDIVAGDFYWMEQVNGKILFAVADCTGHGVPGALVSIVCNNGLNRSVREYGLEKPSEILEKTNEIIISEFKKSDDNIRDGMDISLCALDFERNQLQWAGANNPLWIVRNGKILITKGDRQSIGFSSMPKPFTNHEVEINSGDMIYIFSDGYKDQFGSEKRVKYKSNNFRQLLISISDKNMEEQRKLLDLTFENWKGDYEQIDDVCILGVLV